MKILQTFHIQIVWWNPISTTFYATQVSTFGNVGSWYIDGIFKLLVEAGRFSSMDLVMNIGMVWTDDEKSPVNIENNQA